MESYDLIDVSKHINLWKDVVEIYNASFPEWEREDSEVIFINVKSGKYRMMAYVQNGVVKGFSILDINHKLQYTLFTFLAVKENDRNHGIGSILCKEAIRFFQKNTSDWLLIEAEDRQARFYARFGFKKILIDYSIPAYNSLDSIPMNLMVIEKHKKINHDMLTNILESVFIEGYSLKKSDIRLKIQLNKVPSVISFSHN